MTIVAQQALRDGLVRYDRGRGWDGPIRHVDIAGSAQAALRVLAEGRPISLLLTDVSVPLAMVRSALVKPVTARLKVMVTSEVSPAFSASSATTMVAVGRSVSIA